MRTFEISGIGYEARVLSDHTLLFSLCDLFLSLLPADRSVLYAVVVQKPVQTRALAGTEIHILDG